MKNKNRLLFSVLVFFISLIYFYVVNVKLRFITGDEGYFAYSAKAILNGKVPYKDFFYPQAFLYPYFLASWIYVFGESWEILRIFSALICAGISSIIFNIVSLKRNNICGLFAIIVFACTDLVIAYFSSIKNYSLSCFFLLLSIQLFDSKIKYKYFLAGFIFALSFQIRSYLIICGIIFLYQIFSNKDLCLNEKRKNIKIFILGCLLATIPSILMFISNPDTFIFNNLTYHSLRNRNGLISGFSQKMTAFFSLFQGGKNNGAISIQLVILIAISFCKKINFKSIYFQTVLVLFFISFLPTPVYSQYFVVVVPFLIIYIFENRSYLYKKFFGVGAMVLFFIFFCEALPEFHRYLFTGENVSGVFARRTPTLWRARSLDDSIFKLSEQIYLEEGKKKNFIFSSWSGYLIGLKKIEAFSGLENHFAVNIVHKLTKEEKKKYKISLSPSDLERMVEEKKIRYLILGYRDKKRILQRLAIKSGFKKSYNVRNVVFLKL